MTGRDLIIYISTNKLENEPIFRNGKLLGFMTIEEVAAKLGVGKATVYAMLTTNKLEYICIGDTVLIPANALEERINKNEQ